MKTKFSFTVTNFISYIIGTAILSLGVVLAIHSGIGAGAWDCVNAHLGFMINISLGLGSFIITTFLILILILLHKDWRYIMLALPNYGVSLALDFWDILIFHDIEVYGILILVTYVLSVILIPLGLSFLIMSTFPAGVYDELALYFMKITKGEKFVYYKFSLEIVGILIAIVLGIIAGVSIETLTIDMDFITIKTPTYGVMSFGTIIFTVTIGPLMGLYMKIFDREDGSNEIK